MSPVASDRKAAEEAYKSEQSRDPEGLCNLLLNEGLSDGSTLVLCCVLLRRLVSEIPNLVKRCSGMFGTVCSVYRSQQKGYEKRRVSHLLCQICQVEPKFLEGAIDVAINGGGGACDMFLIRNLADYCKARLWTYKNVLTPLLSSSLSDPSRQADAEWVSSSIMCVCSFSQCCPNNATDPAGLKDLSSATLPLVLQALSKLVGDLGATSSSQFPLSTSQCDEALQAMCEASVAAQEYFTSNPPYFSSTVRACCFIAASGKLPVPTRLYALQMLANLLQGDGKKQAVLDGALLEELCNGRKDDSGALMPPPASVCMELMKATTSTSTSDWESTPLNLYSTPELEEEDVYGHACSDAASYLIDLARSLGGARLFPKALSSIEEMLKGDW